MIKSLENRRKTNEMKRIKYETQMKIIEHSMNINENQKQTYENPLPSNHPGLNFWFSWSAKRLVNCGLAFAQKTVHTFKTIPP